MKLSDKVIHNIHVVITMKRPVTLAVVCFQTPSWPFPWNTTSTVNNHKVLSKSKAEKLRQDLIDYRLSLHGSGSSCVSGITLATGFSIQFIDKIVDNALCLYPL